MLAESTCWLALGSSLLRASLSVAGAVAMCQPASFRASSHKFWNCQYCSAITFN